VIDDIAAIGGKVAKVVGQYDWDYFAHVNKGGLDAHFFERMERQQGLEGIYYLGTPMHFEGVLLLAEYADALASCFF